MIACSTQIADTEIDEWIARYDEITITHPNLEVASERLRRFTVHAISPRLIFLQGLTGVGKSRLARRTMERFHAEIGDQLLADPGWIPMVMVQAPATAGRAFDWKHLYLAVLEELQEPLIDQKIVFDDEAGGDIRFAVRRATTGRDLRRAMVQAVQHRRTKALFIDEGTHLLTAGTGRTFVHQLDHLKSVVNDTGIVIVLIGTPDMMDMLDESPHLVRRRREVALPRYGKSKHDTTAFRQALRALLNRLPAPIECDEEIWNRWQYLHKKTVGCVGMLKDLLMDACIVAMEHGSIRLTIEHVEACALSDHECDLLEAAADGRPVLSGWGPAEGDASSKPDSTSPTNRRRKVGQRKPVRDPIGPPHASED